MTAASAATDSGPDAKRPPTRAMRKDGERFRLLVENTLDLVVEVTLAGEMHYVSPNIRGVLGYAADELVGTNAYGHVHPDDVASVRAQFALPGDHRATCRCRHQDGSWRWLEITGRSYLNPAGHERGVLIARDVTAVKQAEAERARLEAQLCKTEKLAALGTLAGGIAHDFNNMLTAIIAYASLARMETHEANVLDSLTEVLRAADRAKNLTAQILSFSCQQRQRRRPAKLTEVVREVLKLLRPTLSSTIEVVVDLDEATGPVLADPTQMHRVIVNLCTNAIHAMRQQPRGRLEVRLATVRVDEALAPTQPRFRPGPHVRLSVIDTGHGMDAATRQRIFEPLFTTKLAGEGTGLGLAVVQRIVSDHDGVIQVSSQPGHGAAFHLFFPVCAETAAPGALEPTLDPNPGARLAQPLVER